MKKNLIILLCTCIVFSVAGCGSENGTAKRSDNNTLSVNDVLEAGKNEADAKKEETEVPSVTFSGENAGQFVNENSQSEENGNGSGESGDKVDAESSEHFDMSAIDLDKVDVDLTTLSSTMVYSEVYNMMTEPDDYIGKVIKMNGAFKVFHDEGTSNYYFACIVKDATACCAQGIEFVLAGEHKFPQDYPYEDDEICVVGVYDTYKEGDSTYCTLKNAKIL